MSVAVGDGALANGGEAGRAKNNALKFFTHRGRQCEEDGGASGPRRDIIDLFHLINTAGDHTLKRSHRAQKFFGLLKHLEHCFALGHGRYIDRSMAAFLGEPYRVCETQVGHRKMGYLIGVPERFLVKFRNFYHSLQIRMRHESRWLHGGGGGRSSGG